MYNHDLNTWQRYVIDFRIKVQVVPLPGCNQQERRQQHRWSLVLGTVSAYATAYWTCPYSGEQSGGRQWTRRRGRRGSSPSSSQVTYHVKDWLSFYHKCMVSSHTCLHSGSAPAWNIWCFVSWCTRNNLKSWFSLLWPRYLFERNYDVCI